jgi:hypothetical protein
MIDGQREGRSVARRGESRRLCRAEWEGGIQHVFGEPSSIED